jgi:pimeloyl-ACP methyl ester carboxylesterase
VVRYDDRGSGLSDRVPAEVSFEAWIADLDAVANAAGFARFVLLGMSQAGATAIAYAARRPERVRALVLHGAYMRGSLRGDVNP